MATISKLWDDGGVLSVTYEGSGDGSAVFTSDSNEGIDREMSVTFKAGSASVDRVVRQEGIRERFITSDGLVFCLSDGGRFAVLKEGGVPDEPTLETYTRLTHIECTTKQYFDTGYELQETDTIEAYYDTVVESADKFLFCCGNTWLSLYSTYAYVRFGMTSSKSINNGTINHYIKLKKGSVVLDVTTTTLTFDTAPTGTLKMFGGYNSNGLYNGYKGEATMFKITNGNGDVVMELHPVKRNSDGKIGMLDLVSGKFYASETDTDFIGGNEIRITEDYEVIDRTYFNEDKVFDTGFYGNNTTYIDVLFQRTDISGNDYLYGCSNGNRFTAYLPPSSSGYWRYGSAYGQFITGTKKIYKGVITPTKLSVDRNSKSISPSAFTTDFTIPLGGHTPSSGVPEASYQGYVYYFRMKHGDELLLDWFPCKRKSDGVEGFWDCVSQTFVEPI